ncbi:unnamed protein product [Psylliodes chrysocephalus]|uniref:Peptidase A2 domain-containing protein n=1 Tax=Psylliodes chrysocephalus TaxID=3402493 RepID=A0A9P0D2R3_9CUCU|nr:unnamed protein product [Psylliodes chrysocephala]
MIFNRMAQEENETFNCFFTKIETQVKKCKFKDMEERILKDKIIIGIRNENLREKLLSMDEPSLAQTLTLCRNSEIRSKQMETLKNENIINVNAIKNYKKCQTSPSTSSETFECRRCDTTHGRKQCPAFGKRCRICNNIGHFTKCCRKRQKSEQIKHGRKRETRTRVNVIDTDSEISDFTRSSSQDTSDEDFFVNVILKCSEIRATKTKKEDFIETIKIGRQLINIIFDTGAECNVISEKLIRDPSKNIKTSGTKIMSIECAEEDAHAM